MTCATHAKVYRCSVVPMSLGTLFNPAGGVRYHLRARQYSESLWQPFRWALGEFLLGFHPKEETLLLVGPSAGYCLQPFLFERFERIVCLEPEPIARYLFERKLRRAKLEREPVVEFIAIDHLVRYPERLPKLVESLGNCALLFSNVLGQLRGLLGVSVPTELPLLRVHAAVREAISGRSFVSFHDRVSGGLRPSFIAPYESPRRLTDDEVTATLYTHNFGGHKTAPIALLDHFTDGIFPATLPHTYFTWELEPGCYHLIEAVRSG